MGFCFGGVVATASAAADYNSGHSYISPEDRRYREAMRADDLNRKWYPVIFKRIQDALSNTWNIASVDMGCGGVIHAQYKKYPNVYFDLDIYYTGLHEKGLDSNFDAKFYIDAKHWTSITFSSICLFDDNKERQNRAIKDLNRLVERGVELYCQDLHIPINEPSQQYKLIFDVNGKEHWTYISKESAQNLSLREGAINSWFITETTDKPSEYGTIKYTGTRIVEVKFNDIQIHLLKLLVNTNVK